MAKLLFFSDTLNNRILGHMILGVIWFSIPSSIGRNSDAFGRSRISTSGIQKSSPYLVILILETLQLIYIFLFLEASASAWSAGYFFRCSEMILIPLQYPHVHLNLSYVRSLAPKPLTVQCRPLDILCGGSHVFVAVPASPFPNKYFSLSLSLPSFLFKQFDPLNYLIIIIFCKTFLNIGKSLHLPIT